MSMLEVENLHAYYGAIQALKGVSLTVPEGAVVSLIGANGAGKSTLLMTICGNPQAREGRIVMDGTDITRMPTHKIAQLRLAHAPEGRRVFPRLTVAENLRLGALVTDGSRYDRNLDRAFELFPRLKERRGQRAGTLSGGEQQMLAIGRALMAEPRLLLLDEPSLGLAPILVKQIFSAIEAIARDEKVSILLVEQNAFHALKLADHAYVLVNGKIEMEGAGRALLTDPQVRAAYLEGGRH